MATPKKSPAVSSVTNLRDYFSSELKTVMHRQKVGTSEHSFEYLVGLLVGYLESNKFFQTSAEGKLENNFLVDLYRAYIEGGIEQKMFSLKRLGDISLFISGFFADSLNKKLVDIDYYQGMGTTAYSELSSYNLHKTNKTIFKELSEKFKILAEVFGELSERSGLQTNRDLLRLYEKWLVTGSSRLKNLLSEKGISNPVFIDPKIKH